MAALEAVGEAIAVGIAAERIGASEPHLGPVVEAVTVGIGVVRVGASLGLVGVGQPVAVGVKVWNGRRCQRRRSGRRCRRRRTGRSLGRGCGGRNGARSSRRRGTGSRCRRDREPGRRHGSRDRRVRCRAGGDECVGELVDVRLDRRVARREHRRVIVGVRRVEAVRGLPRVGDAIAVGVGGRADDEQSGEQVAGRARESHEPVPARTSSIVRSVTASRGKAPAPSEALLRRPRQAVRRPSAGSRCSSPVKSDGPASTWPRVGTENTWAACVRRRVVGDRELARVPGTRSPARSTWYRQALVVEEDRRERLVAGTADRRCCRRCGTRRRRG